MSKKEEFKAFVKLHPELIKFVKSNEMNLGVVDIQEVLKNSIKKLYGSNVEKNILYSKSYLVRHYDYTWPNDPYDKYKEVKDVLLALEKEVRSRKKENREER